MGYREDEEGFRSELKEFELRKAWLDECYDDFRRIVERKDIALEMFDLVNAYNVKKDLINLAEKLQKDQISIEITTIAKIITQYSQAPQISSTQKHSREILHTKCLELQKLKSEHSFYKLLIVPSLLLVLLLVSVGCFYPFGTSLGSLDREEDWKRCQDKMQNNNTILKQVTKEDFHESNANETTFDHFKEVIDEKFDKMFQIIRNESKLKNEDDLEIARMIDNSLTDKLGRDPSKLQIEILNEARSLSKILKKDSNKMLKQTLDRIQEQTSYQQLKQIFESLLSQTTSQIQTTVKSNNSKLQKTLQHLENLPKTTYTSEFSKLTQRTNQILNLLKKTSTHTQHSYPDTPSPFFNWLGESLQAVFSFIGSCISGVFEFIRFLTTEVIWTPFGCFVGVVLIFYVFMRTCCSAQKVCRCIKVCLGLMFIIFCLLVAGVIIEDYTKEGHKAYLKEVVRIIDLDKEF
ncbi:unnamed protein product [Moneuplotes crassus]|uniref:Uncharacterized protein n=1 Tax=Euplotes crassus TaxID=5936 RepID=A0AAD1ULG4_EUPCR|nr:unnamed protein product [Moneuplotes crassus]